MKNGTSKTECYQAATEADALILEAKARTLARPTTDDTVTESIEVVTFMLADETYAIETTYVNEVHSLNDLTTLPGTPPFVAGIINVHGQVFSVINLKTFFELPAQGVTDLNKVIIISNGDMEFGILADTILDVRRIPLAGMQPTLPTLTGIREDYLLGIFIDRLVVLDAIRLLTDHKIIVNEEVQ